jgi:hypothetical protein
MTEILSKIKKDTGKFWSFKDTTRHSHIRRITKKDVVRIFTLKKSFLVKISNSNTNSFEYVIPLSFTSSIWPRGYYTGILGSCNTTFNDNCIVDIVYKNKDETFENK